jgi:hypothetical protein
MLGQLLNSLRSAAESQIAAERDHYIAPYIGGNGSLRVLDLGNGSLRPQYILLQAVAYGIDLVDRPRWNSFNAAYVVARAISRWKLRRTYQGGFKRLVLVASWFAWYELLFVGWPRYISPPAFLGRVFVAAMLSEWNRQFGLRFTLKMPVRL